MKKRLITCFALSALCMVAWMSGRIIRNPLHTAVPSETTTATSNQNERTLIATQGKWSASTQPHQMIRNQRQGPYYEFREKSPQTKPPFGMDIQNLQKYEGSHTLEELFSGSDEPTAFSLNSSWFFRGSNSPQVRIRLQENPDTGRYEALSSEVLLPSGIGITYEEDGQTGEQKTFLNLKKEF